LLTFVSISDGFGLTRRCGTVVARPAAVLRDPCARDKFI
jgi:hypothetical protein